MRECKVFIFSEGRRIWGLKKYFFSSIGQEPRFCNWEEEERRILKNVLTQFFEGKIARILCVSSTQEISNFPRFTHRMLSSPETVVQVMIFNDNVRHTKHGYRCILSYCKFSRYPLNQWCPTCGPRAACGPLLPHVRPTGQSQIKRKHF